MCHKEVLELRALYGERTISQCWLSASSRTSSPVEAVTHSASSSGTLVRLDTVAPGVKSMLTSLLQSTCVVLHCLTFCDAFCEYVTNRFKRRKQHSTCRALLK